MRDKKVFDIEQVIGLNATVEQLKSMEITERITVKMSVENIVRIFPRSV